VVARDIIDSSHLPHDVHHQVGRAGLRYYVLLVVFRAANLSRRPLRSRGWTLLLLLLVLVLEEVSPAPSANALAAKVSRLSSQLGDISMPYRSTAKRKRKPGIRRPFSSPIWPNVAFPLILISVGERCTVNHFVNSWRIRVLQSAA
jgi:hypothetical protein